MSLTDLNSSMYTVTESKAAELQKGQVGRFESVPGMVQCALYGSALTLPTLTLHYLDGEYSHCLIQAQSEDHRICSQATSPLPSPRSVHLGILVDCW